METRNIKVYNENGWNVEVEGEANKRAVCLTKEKAVEVAEWLKKEAICDGQHANIEILSDADFSQEGKVEISPKLVIDLINELTNGNFEIKNKKVAEDIKRYEVVTVETMFLEKHNANMYCLVTNHKFKIGRATFVRYFRIMPNKKTGVCRILGE